MRGAARRSANINVMYKAVEKAAYGLKRDFGEVENLQVSMKGPADFVSAADHRAENACVKSLSVPVRAMASFLKKVARSRAPIPSIAGSLIRLMAPPTSCMASRILRFQLPCKRVTKSSLA